MFLREGGQGFSRGSRAHCCRNSGPHSLPLAKGWGTMTEVAPSPRCPPLCAREDPGDWGQCRAPRLAPMPSRQAVPPSATVPSLVSPPASGKNACPAIADGLEAGDTAAKGHSSSCPLCHPAGCWGLLPGHQTHRAGRGGPVLPEETRGTHPGARLGGRPPWAGTTAPHGASLALAGSPTPEASPGFYWWPSSSLAGQGHTTASVGDGKRPG